MLILSWKIIFPWLWEPCYLMEYFSKTDLPDGIAMQPVTRLQLAILKLGSV